MKLTEKHKRRIHSINMFLNRPIAVIIVLLALFAYFIYSNHTYQAQNRQLLISANNNTMSTNKVVKGQTDILNAIKQLASDSKLDNNVKTNIIICMLQVPVAQRTTDLQEQCRKDVEAQIIGQSGVALSTTRGGGTTSIPLSSPASPGKLSSPSQSPSTPQSTSGGGSSGGGNTPSPGAVQSILNGIRAVPSTVNNLIKGLF